MNMTGWIFVAVLLLALAVIWINLAKRANPRAKIGPDGTNVRSPESFVVHHEGKGQGLDIANTALKERTKQMRRDLPGETTKIKTPVPGRDLIHMDAPPSDISKYGDEKVAPGATPGQPGAESKASVLMKGPKGSRPETPEEPGSPYAKGRRVTDNHRDVELAEDILPNVFPEQGPGGVPNQAASPSTNGKEPGYGLGRTAPGETDGEGGQGSALHANTFEQSHADERGTNERSMKGRSNERGRVVPLRGRTNGPDAAKTEQAMELQPASNPSAVGGEGVDWSVLQQEQTLPTDSNEDAVVAMVRNPRSLYVYWDLEGQGEKNLRAMLGDEASATTVPCLRVFDVTMGANPSQFGGETVAIDVQPSDDHYFINDKLTPGHQYVVSYEHRSADGQQYLLTHTRVVQMPHDSPAEDGMLYQTYGRQPNGWSGSPWR